MKIGIDASLAINEKAGVGRYAYELIKHLLKIDQKNEYHLLVNFFRHREEKNQKIRELVGKSKNVKLTITHLPGKLKEIIWQNSFVLPFDFYFKNIDIYHALDFQTMPYKINVPSLLTIYDLSFLVYPQFHGQMSNFYLRLTRRTVNQAKKIIAISASTKQDLMKMLHVPESKVQVIYLGVDKKFHQLAKTKKENFILASGTVEPRKNLVRLIKAFNLLDPKIKNIYKLVIAGSYGWQYSEIFAMVKDLKLEEKVIFLGRVNDEELVKLYNQAKVFVYPSLYEGFGLPLLEAMACGAPVITSNISSLPEVIGQAGILIDPNQEKEITHALTEILTDKNRQKEFSRKSLAQAKKFSWEKCARETLEVYEETKEQKNRETEKQTGIL